MLYAFDLDGVLIDSEDLVRECYEKAGANPPPDFFGKTFKEWALVDGMPLSELNKIHAKKTELYFEAIKQGRLKAGPMMDLYQKIKDNETTHIMTGASYQTCTVMVQHFNLRPAARVHCSHSLEMKIAAMNREAPQGGVMFEDITAHYYEMLKATKWTVCLVG